MDFGKVVGRFLEIIPDSSDVDETPDIVPLTGQVVFAPLTETFLVAEPGVTSAVAMNGMFTAELDANGEVGIWLPVSEYSVTFQLAGKRIASIQIAVTADDTAATPVSLAELIEPPADPIAGALPDDGGSTSTEEGETPPVDDGTGEGETDSEPTP